jgi:hypothetical protein
LRLRLEIRAAQLNAACNLELWQLAFESAEELYAVLMHPSNKKAQKSEMMLNYYDKISQVLLLKRPPCLCVSLCLCVRVPLCLCDGGVCGEICAV